MSAKAMHSISEKYVKDGKVVVHEEFAIHGEKGLTVKFYHKENDKIMKVVIVKKAEGYSAKFTMDGKTSETVLTKEQLMKELKKHKELKFAIDFIESAKMARAGSKKSSRKSSKKSSRKSSRKSSKKSSRKMSRKGSKKGSKKGSRKVRKGSRK